MASFTFELPSITQEGLSDREERKRILDALYALGEQLRFVLMNLNEENFDDATKTTIARARDEAGEAKALVEVMPGLIESKVSRTEYTGEEIVSRINQSPEQVSVAAKHIALEGLTTINGAFSVDEAGAMAATGGRIAGWDIRPTHLEGGMVGLSSTTAPSGIVLYAGGNYADRAAAPLRITGDGRLMADKLTARGSITATSGAVGGWQVAENRIHCQTAGLVDAVGTAVAMYAGSQYTARNVAPFRVQADGAVYASQMTIRGGVVDMWEEDTNNARVMVRNDRYRLSMSASFLDGFSNDASAIQQRGFRLNTFAGGGFLNLRSAHGLGTAQFSGDDICHPRVYSQTVASGANLCINPQGYIYRIASSSQRYKRDIRAATARHLDPENLLDIPVVQYRYRKGYLREGEPNRLQIGFIAEDVADIYPAAATIDEDGKPESWNTRAMLPAMLLLLQKLWGRVQGLERRIKALEKGVKVYGK